MSGPSPAPNGHPSSSSPVASRNEFLEDDDAQFHPDRYDADLAEFLSDDGDDRSGPSKDMNHATSPTAASQIDPDLGREDGEDGDGDGEEAESFAYPGAESFSYTGAGSPSDFLGGDDEDADVNDTETYRARMRSILGSEDAEDEDEEQDQKDGSAPDASEPAREEQASPHDDDPDMTSELPDQTLQSIPDTFNDARFRYRASATRPRSGSFSSSIPSTSDRPQRPLEYPALSRLRSQGLSGSPRQSRGDGPASRFGSIGSLWNSLGREAPGISSSSSLLSRSTSVSGSAPGRKRGLYPYGPKDLYSSSDVASASARDSIEGLEKKRFDTANSGVAPEDRGLFQWSAMRKSAFYFQAGATNRKSITTASNQTLPDEMGDKTVFCVGGGLLAVGTTRGYTLIFEFSQELKCLCGNDTLEQSAGSVTALAFSADHTFVAVGHALGQVFIYDLSRPSSPVRHIPSVSAQDVAAGRKEGHLGDARVLHVSFVGTRHTAVFTADDHGLSFYHSMGKILGVASNDTLRMLGRYPTPSSQPGTPNASASKRPSLPVVAMSALPLGPENHPADSIHFVALMTSQKLVVAGLRPNARTWFRKYAPRQSHFQEKDVAVSSHQTGDAEEHHHSIGSSSPEISADKPSLGRVNGVESAPSEVTACASWFPALKAEEPSQCTDEDGVIAPRLAYAFSRQLFLVTIRQQEVAVRPEAKSSRQSQTPQSKMILRLEDERLLDASSEPIESIQWLSHELLLLQGATALHLYDLRLRRITEIESIQPTLHGFIKPTCAFHAVDEARSGVLQRHIVVVGPVMRTLRGKAFFITESQIVVGHLLSWADRILALVSGGDFLSAISLTTAYYEGKVPGSLVGLPSDRDAIKQQVGSKLRELMSASARYAFSPDRLTDSTHVTPDGRGVDRTALFEGLASACATACLALGDTTFLFEDLYDLYADNGIESIFVGQMQAFILDGRMRQLPIPVTQRLFSSCQRTREYAMAEQIVWHVDPLCLDLDQVLSFCSRQKLYDAIAYVYIAALHDFVSPLVELLEPLKAVLRDRDASTRRSGAEEEGSDPDPPAQASVDDVYTVFSYLCVVLLGKSYPAQEDLAVDQATKAKQSLYAFLFSGHCISWPPGPGGTLVLSVDEGEEEPTFPYLRLLLLFDAEALLDALDIAFEDGYLDGELEESTERREQGQLTRQRVVDTLLELSPSLSSEGAREFIAIFVARNAPKYPQFIRLDARAVDQLLHTLACSEEELTREDRQLAAEYLLSAYKVTFTDDILAMFEHARFWRILQTAYRSSKKWGQLIAMFLNDEDLGSAVFAQLRDVLSRAITNKRAPGSDMDMMIIEATPQLAELDVRETAALMDRFYPEKHDEALEMLDDDPEIQLCYLNVFLGDRHEETPARLERKHLGSSSRELFVNLTARLAPDDLLHAVNAAEPGYFDLELVAESSERHGALDTMLWALDKRGPPRKAFDALDDVIARKVLHMESAASETSPELQAAASQLRRAMGMSVRLCRERCHGGRGMSGEAASGDLPVQEMWYRLLRALVGLIHGVTSVAPELDGQDAATSSHVGLDTARDIVQETLSAMVTSMSADTISFPDLFRRLVNDGPDSKGANGASTSSSVRYYAEVRTVVEGMLTACRLRTDLLSITNRLYDRETFSQFAQLTRHRKRGWRPTFAAVSRQGSPGVTAPHTAAVASPKSFSPMAPKAAVSGGSGPLMRKTPSRGVDFLSIEVVPPAAQLPANGASPYAPLGFGAPVLVATPRLDKGKARDLGDGVRSDSFSDSHAYGGASGAADDYFGAGAGVPAMADPSEVFMQSPPPPPMTPSSHDAAPSRRRQSSASVRDVSVNGKGDGEAYAASGALDHHQLLPEKKAVTVRLGVVS